MLSFANRRDKLPLHSYAVNWQAYAIYKEIIKVSMKYLIFVSALWAFSFGLIKGELTGIDSQLVAAIRLALCALVFLPLLWFRQATNLSLRKASQLIALGAIQFGVMYLAYIQSYQYLPGYLVAVFTIFTPLYVILIDCIWHRRWQAKLLWPVLLSICAAAVIVFRTPEQGQYLTGFLYLQFANVAFAFGQVAYRCIASDEGHARNMFWMYLGGALLTVIATLLTVDVALVSISNRQFMVLVYLGVIASGIGFYCWNKGASRVSALQLAIMNNGYVPLAVLFAVLIFGESADWLRLLIGSGLLVSALWLADKMNKGT